MTVKDLPIQNSPPFSIVLKYDIQTRRQTPVIGVFHIELLSLGGCLYQFGTLQIILNINDPDS